MNRRGCLRVGGKATTVFPLTMKALFATAALVLSALAVQAQDAAQMIRQIRLSATLNKSDLQGSIRKDNQKRPLWLFLQNENIQFDLGNNERFHIRMGDEKCDLLQLDDKGVTKPFPDAKLVQPIAGTDITYEDLTLRFLYWPNAKLIGEQNMRGEDCYQVRLDNPRPGNGAFGAVYVWIHKKYGAFWNIKAYDRNGAPLKEFQVTKVMQLPDGKYTLKQMRINKLGPDERVQAVTYLEFDDPVKRTVKGPKR